MPVWRRSRCPRPSCSTRWTLATPFTSASSPNRTRTSIEAYDGKAADKAKIRKILEREFPEVMGEAAKLGMPPEDRPEHKIELEEGATPHTRPHTA